MAISPKLNVMNSASNNYINQYRIAFYISWLVLYFIFPAWYNPQIYISFTNKIIDVPFLTHLIGFVLYFFAAAIILNLLLNTLVIEEPLIVRSDNQSQGLKDNLPLIIVCCTAAALHVFSYSVTLGNSKYSLWIYRYISYYWGKLADFPIQYPAWLSLVMLFVILKVRRLNDFVSGFLNSAYSIYKSSLAIKLISMVVIVAIFFIYTNLLPSYSLWDHLLITGEPPLGTLLHLVMFLLFGTGNILLPAVIVQFSFYILSGIFLYKTINLFCQKETALLGASIYLFSPLIFTYATLGHLQSGVVFFIILNSYFFLKFIKEGHNRDLILTAYFISIGCLYKREIILMLFICSAYLIADKILRKDLSFKSHVTPISILSLSLISFLPWYFIGTRGADEMVSSHLSQLDQLFSAFLRIPSQISWPISLLLLFSIVFALFIKRDRLSFFWGGVFVAYYFLYASLAQQTVHRYSMAFYPAISIFLALFIQSLIQKVRWNHTYKLVFSALIIYLAILCIIPRSSTKLITFKYSDFENQSFPFDKSVEWVLNNTANDENVLALMRGQDEINQELKGTHQGKIFYLGVGALFELWPSDDPDKLRQALQYVCEKSKISYIMFPVTDATITHPRSDKKAKKIMGFLEKNNYDDFSLAAKFNMDDNYIYIYKLKGNFVNNQ